MEELTQRKGPGPYLAQILKVPVSHLNKRRITQVIAEAWGIPEDKILSCTEQIDVVHPSPYSAKGERVKIPGERHIPYVNARKFYFYVMIEIKHYPWRELKMITGRKIAAINYYVKKAKEHMTLEKAYMTKAQMVIDAIARDEVIFPIPTIIYIANAEVIDRRPVHEDSPNVPLSGPDS